MTIYEGFDYLKYVASNAKTVNDVISALQAQIKELEALRKDGVEIDLQNISDGHLTYYTDDSKIAKKHRFHKVEEDEES